jgi:hypothetical protein
MVMSLFWGSCICVRDSSNNTISNNTCKNNNYGIYIISWDIHSASSYNAIVVRGGAPL